jgi:hypothetical protein
MKFTPSASLCALLFAGASLSGGYAQAAGSLADTITSAVADPGRPEGDRNRDVARKPVESLQPVEIQRSIAKSQTATPTPAMHDGQHDFDFNIGVWHTHIRRTLDPFASGSESVELNGTVTVRKVWDGKAELEEIEADGPKGHWEGLTLFLYNPSAHQWSQSFANSKVGTLSSNVGEFRDGRVVLIGQDTVDDKSILVRAVWSDIKPESHQYEESYSNDGGTTWVRAFIANLTRLRQ